LLAGAIGDALGAPVEFDSVAEIRTRFGPDGVTAYAPAYGRIGAITDDTQMTLFTAEGLIRWQAHADAGGVSSPIAIMRLAYLRWLTTQGHRVNHPDSSGWLVSFPGLHSSRAPGVTCIGALASSSSQTPARPANDSKGCGGVMRMAPVGVLGAQAFDLGCEFAAITHGHPTGSLASGAFALTIAELLAGRTLADAVHVTRTALVEHPQSGETVEALDVALALAASGTTPTPEAIETLGGGWVAEEALAIGVYCALVAPDLRAGLLLAVNHSGDSDSTGSITGNLLGAMHGVAALPIDLLEELELADTIERVAEDLASALVDGLPIDTTRYPPN
jgi:ADP-ribosylglycohydrolase